MLHAFRVVASPKYLPPGYYVRSREARERVFGLLVGHPKDILLHASGKL